MKLYTNNFSRKHTLGDWRWDIPLAELLSAFFCLIWSTCSFRGDRGLTRREWMGSQRRRNWLTVVGTAISFGIESEVRFDVSQILLNLLIYSRLP